MKKRDGLVKVFWEDAVIYKELPKQLKLARKMTMGELIKETAEYLVIKNPVTGKYSEKEKIYIPTINSKHTFFFNMFPSFVNCQKMGGWGIKN